MSKIKLYVGKISSSVKSSDLEDEFSKYGKVANCDVRGGYGFVEFSDKKDAEDAIDGLHDKEIGGSKVIVEWAREDRRAALKGPTSKDLCYNCGKRGHCSGRSVESVFYV